MEGREWLGGVADFSLYCVTLRAESSAANRWTTEYPLQTGVEHDGDNWPKTGRETPRLELTRLFRTDIDALSGSEPDAAAGHPCARVGNGDAEQDLPLLSLLRLAEKDLPLV